MAFFVLRRVLITIPLLWGVATLVFLSIHLVPGDPVQAMMVGHASAAEIERVRHQLGLDQPLVTQYWRFLVNAAHLNFGHSIRSGRPVWSEILERWPDTVQLAVAALLMGTVIGLVTGILAAALNRTWVGTGIVGVSLLGISVPDFWLGTMLALIFGLRLGWLPIAGMGDWRNLVLPALTIAIGIGAILARVIRASLVDVLSSDYVRTAHAKGMYRRIVFFRHALKNAIIPALTIYGLLVAYVLGGVVIVENVFAWPGLGSYAVSAVEARDFPAIQGTTFLFAVILIIANLLTDLSYGLLDPRIRYS
jgi:peptide/nickel transport system permease protein